MSKAVIQPFEDYQKSRIMFVQTIAELARKKGDHIKSLKSFKVMDLLSPLLNDPVASIKQSAALAIGRLSKHDIELANKVIEDNGRIIKLLLESDTNNKFYKKSTCFIIARVAHHGEKLAETLVKYDVISFLVKCLEEYDPTVKEAAAWGLGYISKHSEKLALKVVSEPNAIDYLILCLQEPEINIKKITIQTLTHIAKHSQDLTERINHKDNLSYILYFLVLKDYDLKAIICNCLANMANKSPVVASKIISDLQPKQLLECIESENPNVKKNAITLINEIASRDELSSIVNDKINADHFIKFLRDNKGSERLYAIPLISTMAKHKQEIAKKFVDGGVLGPLLECLSTIKNKIDEKKENKKMGKNDLKKDLRNDTKNNATSEFDDKAETLACDAIAELSKHTHEITNDIASHKNLIPTLLYLAVTRELSNKLKKAATKALQEIIMVGDKLKPLHDNENLLLMFLEKNESSTVDDTNYEQILVTVVRKIKELLNSGHLDKSDKKDFLKDLSLKKIINLAKKYRVLDNEIPEFENIYSPDIVNFYNEDYAKKLQDQYLSKL